MRSNCNSPVAVKMLLGTLAIAATIFSSDQAAAQAGAEPRNEYRAEILVLRHLNNESRSFEAPPRQAAPADPSDEVTPPIEEEKRVRWRGLPWAEFKLKSENTRLRRSRDFRPLLHLGWTQAALDSDEAGWIPVRGRADDGTRIDGRARLTVNRYLNLRLELDADIPDKGEFKLAQSRRMKSSELHYFDHPEFGVLVMVIPEPPPESPPEPPPETEPQGEVDASAASIGATDQTG